MVIRLLTPSKQKTAPSRSPLRRRLPALRKSASALVVSTTDASRKHSNASSAASPLSSKSRPMLHRAREWDDGVETASLIFRAQSRVWRRGVAWPGGPPNEQRWGFTKRRYYLDGSFVLFLVLHAIMHYVLNALNNLEIVVLRKGAASSGLCQATKTPSQ